MSEDATQRDRFASDEPKDEDVEGHRHKPATDEGKDEGDSDDDVEAHRKHGGA